MDGANLIASDAETLDDMSLHRVHALLVHQRVSAVDVDPANRTLELNLENGADLRLERSSEALDDEAIWVVESPGGLVIIRTITTRDEATPVTVNQIPLGDVTPASMAEQVGQLLSAA